MRRAYFCSLVLGPDGRRYPAGFVARTDWTAVDLRPDPASAPAAGELFVVAEVTPVEHAALVATPGVAYLPMETGGAVWVPIAGSTVGDLTAANRIAIRDLLEARHVPAHVFTLQTPLRRAVRLVEGRAILRQILGPDDLTEGLDTTIGAMTAARRQAIRAKLVALGLDFDFATAATTIRQFIMGVLRQNARVMQTSTPEDADG